MKHVLIPIGFLIALAADGILLPAVFHIQTVSLVIIFLVSILVVYPFDGALIIWGIALAGLAGFWQGLPFGTLILAWLLTAAAWRAAAFFVDMTPAAETRSLGNLTLLLILGMFGMLVAQGLFLILERVFYGSVQSKVFLAMLRTPSDYVCAMIGLIFFTFFLTRFSHGQKLPYQHFR
ncbi:MAG TPA: hypothetical protein VG866_01195 [Candidatus Paceibacterota bacterium]|nr:hypothetical protein [Candidatus Paceibacterota bacterium]